MVWFDLEKDGRFVKRERGILLKERKREREGYYVKGENVALCVCEREREKGKD